MIIARVEELAKKVTGVGRFKTVLKELVFLLIQIQLYIFCQNNNVSILSLFYTDVS